MKNVKSLVFVFVFTAFSATLGYGQDGDVKDVTKQAKNCWVASKAKDKTGKILGYYFKPAGVLTPAKKENPRFFVTSSDVTLVGASSKGNALWVELSINEDSQGVQCLNLDGIGSVWYTPVGGKAEETKITDKDQTVNFDKGRVIFYFPEHTRLNVAVPKK